MSATGSGAGCGVVLGIVLVLLAQQFGLLSLSSLISGIEYLAIAAIIGGVFGAAIGWGLGKHYLSRHPAPGVGSQSPPSS
ncbi:MAG TPA: hypothetical protein VMC82_02040 [Thermoplasmata archaeon]|nr:hypothetical protein [Thermoplasmata archaeon]